MQKQLDLIFYNFQHNTRKAFCKINLDCGSSGIKLSTKIVDHLNKNNYNFL